jgi:hypothetical protein
MECPDSLPIGLRKCVCKVSLICILHPVKSVPRFSPTLSHTYGLSKLFFSFPSARAMRRTAKLTRRDLASSTYPPPLNMAPGTLLHYPSSFILLGREHFWWTQFSTFPIRPEDLLPMLVLKVSQYTVSSTITVPTLEAWGCSASGGILP